MFVWIRLRFGVCLFGFGCDLECVRTDSVAI